eukprot:SAG31_NODE_1555_length_7895_cov_46.107748_1_plen_497_part_00
MAGFSFARAEKFKNNRMEPSSTSSSTSPMVPKVYFMVKVLRQPLQLELGATALRLLSAGRPVITLSYTDLREWRSTDAGSTLTLVPKEFDDSGNDGGDSGRPIVLNCAASSSNADQIAAVMQSRSNGDFGDHRRLIKSMSAENGMDLHKGMQQEPNMVSATPSPIPLVEERLGTTAESSCVAAAVQEGEQLADSHSSAPSPLPFADSDTYSDGYFELLQNELAAQPISALRHQASLSNVAQSELDQATSNTDVRKYLIGPIMQAEVQPLTPTQKTELNQASGEKCTQTCALCMIELDAVQEGDEPPPNLACRHLFCRSCYDRLAKYGATKAKFQCPECIVGVHWRQFWAALICERRCGLCCDNSCTDSNSLQELGRCVDCGEFLCSFHVEAHRRTKATRNHELLSPSQFVESVAANPLSIFAASNPSCSRSIASKRCVLHDQELALYCEDCDLPICRDCGLDGHRTHHFSTVDDAIARCVHASMLSLLRGIIKRFL